MEEQPRDGEESTAGSSGDGMPRWVKVSLVVVLALAVLLVLAQLIGGDHGPGRHAPTGADGTPAGITDHSRPPTVDTRTTP